MEYKVDLVDRNQLLKKIEMSTLQNKRREFFFWNLRNVWIKMS